MAIDASAYAARRAARAHPRAAAVVADAWRRLPLLDDSVAVALVVFAPRAGAEIARVLAPGGTVVAVATARHHLAELAAPLGLLTVDPRKEERLRDALGPELERVGQRELEWTMELDRGRPGLWRPWGRPRATRDRGGAGAAGGALPEPVDTTGAVVLSRWRAG